VYQIKSKGYKLNKPINFNEEKDLKLQQERGISFSNIIEAIDNGLLVDDIKHPNSNKYQNQRIFTVCINSYIYLVPYVETNTDIFLKTVIPNRKANKRYRKECEDLEV